MHSLTASGHSEEAVGSNDKSLVRTQAKRSTGSIEDSLSLSYTVRQ